MPSSSISYRSGALIVVAAAVVALVLGLYAYFAPLTGVNGTAGAIIFIVASAVIALAGLALPVLGRRGLRNTLRVLVLLGLLGTILAGVLLHLWWAVLALAVGLIGVIIDMTRPAHAA